MSERQADRIPRSFDELVAWRNAPLIEREMWADTLDVLIDEVERLRGLVEILLAERRR